MPKFNQGGISLVEFARTSAPEVAGEFVRSHIVLPARQPVFQFSIFACFVEAPRVVRIFQNIGRLKSSFLLRIKKHENDLVNKNIILTVIVSDYFKVQTPLFGSWVQNPYSLYTTRRQFVRWKCMQILLIVNSKLRLLLAIPQKLLFISLATTKIIYQDVRFRNKIMSVTYSSLLLIKIVPNETAFYI